MGSRVDVVASSSSSSSSAKCCMGIFNETDIDINHFNKCLYTIALLFGSSELPKAIIFLEISQASRALSGSGSIVYMYERISEIFNFL